MIKPCNFISLLLTRVKLNLRKKKGGEELVREILFIPSINRETDIVWKTHFIVLKIVIKTPATRLWVLDSHGILTDIFVKVVEVT